MRQGGPAGGYSKQAQRGQSLEQHHLCLLCYSALLPIAECFHNLLVFHIFFSFFPLLCHVCCWNGCVREKKAKEKRDKRRHVGMH